MMSLLLMFIFFGVGIIFGDLFNKIGRRLPNNESIFSNEICPNCGYYYPWYERIPLLSYFACSGRCSMCNVRLNTLEILNELFTGLLFTLSYVAFGMSIETFVAIGITALLMIVIVSDFTYYIISDEVLLIINIYLLLLFLFKEGIVGMLTHTASGLFLFGIMYLVMIIGNVFLKKESLGGGDVKMMFTFGLILGPVMGLFSIFLSSIIALPVSLLVMKTKGESIIPFGPFLVISLLFIFFVRIDFSILFNLFLN